MTAISFWSKPIDEIAESVNSSMNGLSEKDARAVLLRVGPNRLQSKQRVTPLGLFLNQFKSPIVLILIFATAISAILQDWVDAGIILSIVTGSALLSFYQEYNANNAADKLKEQVSFKTGDGQIAQTPSTTNGLRSVLSAESVLFHAAGLRLSASTTTTSIATPVVTSTAIIVAARLRRALRL
jgi:P-type Mg2+ transporter